MATTAAAPGRLGQNVNQPDPTKGTATGATTSSHIPAAPPQQQPMVQMPRRRGRPPKNQSALYTTMRLGYPQKEPAPGAVPSVNANQQTIQNQSKPAQQQQHTPQPSQQRDFPSYYNPVPELNSDRFYRILTELDPYRATPQEFIHLLVHAAVRDVEIAHTLFRWNDDRINHPECWKPPVPPGFTVPQPAATSIKQPQPGNSTAPPVPTSAGAGATHPTTRSMTTPRPTTQPQTTQPQTTQPQSAQPPAAESPLNKEDGTPSSQKRKRDETAEQQAKLQKTSQSRTPAQTNGISPEDRANPWFNKYKDLRDQSLQGGS
ncbi:hypothetical protein GGR50DRAFT_695231 [Xylaria sp. CBS 124048]|nr:hypothetical protein GGR50DRAFT_695231 [Xylaria sp. CBS 124048]